MPSIDSLRTYLKITTPSLQDYLLYKLVLDVHEAYAKLFGYPLYKLYRNKVIPLAVEYYTKIDSSSFKKVIRKFKRYTNCSSCNVNLSIKINIDENTILLLQDKETYLAKYKDEMISFSNLTEGCSPKLYYA